MKDYRGDTGIILGDGRAIEIGEDVWVKAVITDVVVGLGIRHYCAKVGNGKEFQVATDGLIPLENP